MTHLFRAAFQESSAPMLIVTEDGKVLHANQAACTVLDCELSDLLGKPWCDANALRRACDGSRWELQRERLVEDEEGQGEAGQRLPSHEVKQLGVDGCYLLRLRGQEEPVVETDKLRRSNEALELSNLELQQFAYIASHDLQTPLRAVAGFAQFLAEDYVSDLDARAQQYIDQIVSGTRHMKGLLDNLLTYSRIDSRAKPFEATDLKHIVQQVYEDVAPVVLETNAAVKWAELPIISAEPSQIFQLFHHLIGNALKYRGEQPPQIRIEAVTDENNPEAWVVSVIDNGIGIESRYHDRVFEIFRRLHREDAYPGDGVGLAICRRIVHRHRGRIWVESELGKGSAFRCTFPKKCG